MPFTPETFNSTRTNLGQNIPTGISTALHHVPSTATTTGKGFAYDSLSGGSCVCFVGSVFDLYDARSGRLDSLNLKFRFQTSKKLLKPQFQALSSLYDPNPVIWILCFHHHLLSKDVAWGSADTLHLEPCSVPWLSISA